MKTNIIITENQKKILKYLLEKLGDYFSNQGCNDASEEEIELGRLVGINVKNNLHILNLT